MKEHDSTSSTSTFPKGRFVLAGNSIGQDTDLPIRSANLAKEATLILFESDKGARKVLKAAKIHREYLLYSKKNNALAISSAQKVWSLGQTVALWSDQGMPHVEDPGQEILELAYRSKVKIEVIPGPSSLSSALCVCPFDLHTFKCFGFAPREEQDRQLFLEQTRGENALFFETPYRLRNLLATFEHVQPRRMLFLALDIGNSDQSYRLGTAPTLIQSLPEEKLNFILIAKAMTDSKS